MNNRDEIKAQYVGIRLIIFLKIFEKKINRNIYLKFELSCLYL